MIKKDEAKQLLAVYGGSNCAASQIDLQAALWSVAAARMESELRQKISGTPYLVPLPSQAVAVFCKLQA